jgi:hypothetical protein
MSWLAAARVARTGAGWLLKRWYLVAIAGLAIALMTTRGNLADARADLTAERKDRELDAAIAKAAILGRELGFAQQQATAAGTYADQLARREPIIVKSTDTVREYAQTDAGRARCLGADRVHGLDQLDAQLFPAASAATDGGAVPVPAEPDPAPGGRLGVQR